MSGMKRQADILEAILLTNVHSTAWISDSIIKGRRIRLRGIQIHVMQEDDKVSLSPVLPSMAKALRLLKRHPRCTDITWNGILWKRTDR
jgi:hypothetical protein